MFLNSEKMENGWEPLEGARLVYDWHSDNQNVDGCSLIRVATGATVEFEALAQELGLSSAGEIWFSSGDNKVAGLAPEEEGDENRCLDQEKRWVYGDRKFFAKHGFAVRTLQANTTADNDVVVWDERWTCTHEIRVPAPLSNLPSEGWVPVEATPHFVKWVRNPKFYLWALFVLRYKGDSGKDGVLAIYDSSMPDTRLNRVAEFFKSNGMLPFDNPAAVWSALARDAGDEADRFVPAVKGWDISNFGNNITCRFLIPKEGGSRYYGTVVEEGLSCDESILPSRVFDDGDGSQSFPDRCAGRYSKVASIWLPPEVRESISAKWWLRDLAKTLPGYHKAVRTQNGICGRNDRGVEIPINTLGRWLFGVPGYAAHLRTEVEGEKLMLSLPAGCPRVAMGFISAIVSAGPGEPPPQLATVC